MKNNKYVVHIYNVCNVLMHEKMKPFIFLLALACIISCGSNRRTSSFLSHMDTLYQQNHAEAINSIDSFMSYNRENDLYKFSKRNVHFSPFFRGSSSSLEYHLKGF